MGGNKTTSAIMGAIFGGGTIPMTEGIRKLEENKEKKADAARNALATPTTPTTTSATKTAQDAVNQRRKTILSTGGQTDLTSGQALLLAGQTQKQTLLG